MSGAVPVSEPAVLAAESSLADRLMNRINRAATTLGMVALVAASLVLTSSVISRYVFKASTDWQDESAVFLLVGVTFLCAASVQRHRGHIGIEALASLLPSAVNRLRSLLVDIASALFCGFFAWKSWTLLREAVSDHQTTSSSWGAPLWIPYGLMALGMTLLTLQIVLQLMPRSRREVHP